MIRARRGYAHDLGNKQVVVCLWLVQDAPHWYFHYRAFERQINCAHLTGQFTCVWMECLVWFNCVLVWFNCGPSTDQLCTPDWAAFSCKPRFLLTGETGTYCWFLPIHLLQLTTINQECNDIQSNLPEKATNVGEVLDDFSHHQIGVINADLSQTPVNRV